MEPNDVMGTAVRLGGSVDALAALVAFVRLETEQIPADPAVRDLLSQIATELVGGDGIAEPAAAAPIVGLGRTFLRQAAEMIENPGRSGSWDQVDVPLIQSMAALCAFSTCGPMTCNPNACARSMTRRNSSRSDCSECAPE